MKLRTWILLSLLYLTAIACNTNKNHDHVKENQLLVKANAILQESLDLREEIMTIEKNLSKSIDYSELKAELKIWDKDIVEVPGFEHSHEDEHQRAYHIHNPMKMQSDEQHLQYQQMMYEEIKALHEKFVELKNQIVEM
jgi:hypothetical protein